MCYNNVSEVSHLSKGGEKMSIGEIIYSRRKELGLTLEEVGNFVGVSKSTVKKWESGFISNMRRDKIALLAKILKIEPTKLISETSEPSNISAVILPDKIYRIPVFATVSAGLGAFAENEVVDYIPMIIDNPADVQDTFGLLVRGDSMYPKIEDGDTIVVHRQDSVDSGDIAVMLIDDNDGVVKKVVYGETWVELHSINPEYITRRFEGADVQRLRVVGKVIKVVKSL